MAISPVNATYSGFGPTATGQVIASNTGAGPQAQDFQGYATITGDGTTGPAVVNYIDGIQQISFNPSGLLADVVGGNDTAGAAITKIVDDNYQGAPANPPFTLAIPVGSQTFTVTFSPAIASGKTVKIMFRAAK